VATTQEGLAADSR